MAIRPDSNVLKFSKYGNLVIAVAVVGVLIAIIIPLPPSVLDVLITFNISLAVIVLLVVIYTFKPLEFSVFPSLLLFTTMLRLSLNVATTRRILLDANPGKVIEAFGEFVVGGNFVVGMVIFLILVVIQFVVITKGSGRIAEVAARFTLDAMPGKQMAIDADLNNGIISEQEAKQRRLEINREADFYGAMDGASKFVRGDAIAGIIITFINIIGGLAIGVFQRGMSAGDAAGLYTKLTIGDGLVAQIPSLVIATAAGILVSRAGASENSVGEDLSNQLLGKPSALLIASGTLFFFAIMPGLPFLPFVLLSAATGALGLSTRNLMRTEEEEKEEEAERSTQVPEPERVKSLLHVDPMELEIGYGLITLVDTSQGGDLLDRITLLRRQFATEMGIIVPPIRIHDNLELQPNEYVFRINGTEIAKNEVMVNMYMALNTGLASAELQGIPTTEPSFGLPAVWITEAQKERADTMGYTVVDSSSVLATHISEIIKTHADELLGRQGVQELIDNLKKTNSVVVDELIPNILTVGQVQRVLQNLLREKISIRNLTAILESLSDYGRITKDIDVLSEYVRNTLARQITSQYLNQDGTIKPILLEPAFEQEIQSAIQKTGSTSVLIMEPARSKAFFDELHGMVEKLKSITNQPIILCSPTVRLPLKRFIERRLPHVIVLSYGDMTSDVEIKSIGLLRLEPQLQTA